MTASGKIELSYYRKSQVIDQLPHLEKPFNISGTTRPGNL